MNIHEIHTSIKSLKTEVNKQISFKTIYPICQILNSQFLNKPIKDFFKPYTLQLDNFIYSSAEDPNVCQLRLHQGWENLLFAWIQPEFTALYRIPKTHLGLFGLTLNHADMEAQKQNKIFIQSLRFKKATMDRELIRYLVEVL